MGNRHWTTEEQRVWLEARIPAFVQAQQDKASGKFIEDTYKVWQEKWPTPAPTEDEIKGAGGSAEKALAGQNKAMGNVRIIMNSQQYFCKLTSAS
jgi:hypothetical protein